MPSALDDISSVEMLESLITNDPRWAWILGAWEASADEEQVALARTVHRFRGNFVKETAGLVLKVLGDIQGPSVPGGLLSVASANGPDSPRPGPDWNDELKCPQNWP